MAPSRNVPPTLFKYNSSCTRVASFDSRAHGGASDGSSYPSLLHPCFVQPEEEDSLFNDLPGGEEKKYEEVEADDEYFSFRKNIGII
jgi:hypothetical protein